MIPVHVELKELLVSCDRCQRKSCQLDLQKRLETVDLKKGEDLKACGCSIQSRGLLFFANSCEQSSMQLEKGLVDVNSES